MGVVAGPDVRQVSGELPPECELAPPQGRLKLHDCAASEHISQLLWALRVVTGSPQVMEKSHHGEWLGVFRNNVVPLAG